MQKPPHHKLPEKYVLKHVYHSEIATAYFYEGIVVVEALEGVTLSYKTAFSILVSGLKHVGTKPWVYISNRIHSYSLNPNDYVYLEKVPTLKGLAIVSADAQRLKNAEMESLFFKKSFELFDSLEDSFEWAEELLQKS